MRRALLFKYWSKRKCSPQWKLLLPFVSDNNSSSISYFPCAEAHFLKRKIIPCYDALQFPALAIRKISNYINIFQFLSQKSFFWYKIDADLLVLALIFLKRGYNFFLKSCSSLGFSFIIVFIPIHYLVYFQKMLCEFILFDQEYKWTLSISMKSAENITRGVNIEWESCMDSWKSPCNSFVVPSGNFKRY